MTARMQRWLPKSLPMKRLLAKSMHASKVPPKPDELSWRDYTLMLLHIGAELEHCLMVQYLYAAYSLGGAHVPAEKRDAVRRWQESVLSIAKEEMGHFLTVQNVLILLGGPPAFQREDFPWDSAFYPFPFKFEPLSLDALAKYIYAEAPMNFSGELAEQISARLKVPLKADVAGGEYHQVAELYSRLLEIIGNPELLPDENFHEWRFPAQGSFAQWARNHGTAVGVEANDWNLSSKKDPSKTPPDRVDMIIEQLATRTEVINALKRVAEQGEATSDAGERSHFQRFVDIFIEYFLLFPDESSVPYKPVPTNPSILAVNDNTEIVYPTSRKLAALFDLRYRSLMMCIGMSLRFSASEYQRARPGARATLLQHSFVEMYLLRALANLLTNAPLLEAQDARRAGPTFQLPYTLELPHRDEDCFASLLDIVHASAALLKELGEGDAYVSAEFIASTRNADESWREVLHQFVRSGVRS